MADTLALSDNQRTLLGIAVTVTITLNASLAGLAATNQVVIPPYVYFGLAIATVVIQAVKDKLGVETSSTARVAKFADQNLQQNRVVTGTTTPPVS